MRASIEFVTLSMIFFHVIADYNLQGWLASAKQKEWWKKNAPQELYKHDYLVALLMHSFGWTFLVMLPIAFYFNCIITPTFVATFIVNLVLHAVIDDLKANRNKINLVIDQALHIIQIGLTVLVLL